jgi:hypothetical protein
MPEDGLGTCEVIDNVRLGDGKCDYGDYNRVEFGFDYGDCCSDTCISNAYQCGVNGYDCQDPRNYLSPEASMTAPEQDMNGANEPDSCDTEEHNSEDVV